MKEGAKKTVSCRTVPVDGTKTEVPVNELSFRPSIYGVVIQDGKVLLVPQWDGYDFPGGGVDLGEPILDALVREVKEETGYDVSPKRLLHIEDDFFIHPARKTPHHSILMFYECALMGGELSDDGFSDHEREWSKKAEWIPLTDIQSIRFMNPIDSVALIRALESHV